MSVPSWLGEVLGSIVTTIGKAIADWWGEGKRIEAETEAESRKGQAEGVRESRDVQDRIRDRQDAIERNRGESSPDDVLGGSGWNE